MITLRDIAITFNKGTPLEMQALRGISLAVPQGQFVTMIGSNGAGKSTLLNILAGELTPDTGSILVDEDDVTDKPIHARASKIARLFQDPRAGICEDMSILENIAIASGRTQPRGFAFAITSDIRDKAIERLAMLGVGLENRFNDRVSLLSGGQRQALSLIMATFGSAKVLLLNELLAQKVTNAELARRLGTTPQVVTRIVDLGHATKVDTIADALRALGRRLEISVA